jgi:hypothetical protein
MSKQASPFTGLLPGPIARRALVLFVVLSTGLLLPATGSHAAECYQPHRFSATVVEGLGLPVGDYADAVDLSLGLGLELEYRLLPSVKLGAVGLYRWTTITSELQYLAGQLVEDLVGPGIATTLKLRSYDLMGHAKWLAPVSGTPTPYVRVQAGLYRQTISAEATEVISGQSAEASDSESAFGYGLGVGVEFWGEGKVGAMVEIMYLSGLTDPNSDFFELRAGLKIGFGAER